MIIIYTTFIIFSLLTKNPYIRRFGWDGFVGWFYYRGERFLTTFKMLKDHPFVGVGLDNYRIIFDRYHAWIGTPIEFKIPDNMYLMILGETGIIGFLSFLVFIFFLFRNAISTFCLIKDEYLREFLIVLMLALIGICVNMDTYELFYFTETTYQFWILVGIVVSIINQEKYVRTIQED